MNATHTPSHRVQKDDNRRVCPTVPQMVETDRDIRHEHYVHRRHDHTAVAFRRLQAYHRPDLSRHSMLGNFKYNNTTL